MPEQRPLSPTPELYDLWRSHLGDAQQTYQRAVANFKKVLEEFQQHDFAGSDGSVAVRNAVKAESSARDEYMRVLRIFTDLTLYGKLPGSLPEDKPAEVNGKPAGARAKPQRASQLTPRETEVLRLIASGSTTKEVAGRLGITFKTAQCHRGRILEKLDVHNTADLTRYAVKTGLIRI